MYLFTILVSTPMGFGLCWYVRFDLYFMFDYESNICMFVLKEDEPVEFSIETNAKTGKLYAIDVTGPNGSFVQGNPKASEWEKSLRQQQDQQYDRNY